MRVVGRESGFVEGFNDGGKKVHVFIACLVFHFEQEQLAEGGWGGRSLMSWSQLRASAQWLVLVLLREW